MRGATRAQLPTREQIASIRCPALILAWTGDPGHPVSTADELASLLPRPVMHVDSSADAVDRWTTHVTTFVRELGR